LDPNARSAGSCRQRTIRRKEIQGETFDFWKLFPDSDRTSSSCFVLENDDAKNILRSKPLVPDFKLEGERAVAQQPLPEDGSSEKGL
jgi:hypothetical protein